MSKTILKRIALIWVNMQMIATKKFQQYANKDGTEL